MIHSTSLQNLRFGTIVEAVGVTDHIAHAWRLKNGLTIGREGGGNRRYDLADVARLILMDWLINRLGMSATPAAMMVNAAHSTILLLAMHTYYSIDADELLPEDADRWVMILDRVDGTTRPQLMTGDRFDQSGTHHMIAEIKIELNPLVSLALDRLVGVLGHSALDLRAQLREKRATLPVYVKGMENA